MLNPQDMSNLQATGTPNMDMNNNQGRPQMVSRAPLQNQQQPILGRAPMQNSQSSMLSRAPMQNNNVQGLSRFPMQNGGQPMQMPGRAPGNNMQPMINIPPMNNMSMLPVGNNMMRPMMQLNRPSQHMVTAHGTYAQGSGWNNSAAMVMPHAQLVHPSQASSSSLYH